MTEERVPIAPETVEMLKDLGEQGQKLVDEFNEKKKLIEETNKRLNEIQLNVHGISSTATYLVGREAKKHTNGKYTFNNSDFTLIIEKPSVSDGSTAPSTENQS